MLYQNSTVYVWIDGEFGRITVCYCGFRENYVLKLRQNHGVIMILLANPNMY